jgi:hypothetical protein
MTTVMLVHGGLWEDMDAERFWHRPGIVAGLERAGLAVVAPDRPHRPPDWASEAAHLSAALPAEPVTVVAGSNGCSAAVRLALAEPARVQRLVLAWPATAGDPDVDGRTRAGLAELGAAPATVEALLGRVEAPGSTGEDQPTLRGVTEAELSSLAQPLALNRSGPARPVSGRPIAILPSVPANPAHQRRTVDALLARLPHAVELPGCPESPRPDFPPHLEAFLRAVVGFVSG